MSADQIAGGLAVRNIGPATCTLTGVPDLRLVAATGAPIPLTEVKRGQTLGRLTRWWGYPTVSLRPGAYATASVIGVPGCGPGATKTDVVLTGGDLPIRVVGRVGLERPCYHPRAPVTLYAYIFTPNQAPQPPPVPAIPLQATLSAPHEAHPGRLLRYRVTIGNDSARRYRFRRCPAYWEGIRRRILAPIAPLSKLRGFRLDCAAVPTLAPMTSRTFSMVLRVPASMRPGRGLLVWSVLPARLPPSDFPVSSVPIEIVR